MESISKTITSGASGKDLTYCSSISRKSARSVRASTAFSNRESVGCEERPSACGVRSHTLLSNGSCRSRSASLQSGIPQGNLVEPLPHLLAAIMFDFARIALIREQGRQPLTQPQAIIHLAQ